MKKIVCSIMVSIILFLGFTTSAFAQAKENDKGASSGEVADNQKNNVSISQDQLEGSGLMGYISSRAPQPKTGFGAGIGFYVAVYPILPEPLDNFQIGLASTWIVPKNADNKSEPLCPPGSYARDNWPERAPTYGSVFQTIEGGLGIWGSTQFRAGYKPPKFQIVGVPDCYTGNYLISPGWSNKTTASPDDKMGIAQLSNHFLLPPDGFTFQTNPKGELYEDWAQLFEEMPEKFMIGTDAKFGREGFEVSKYKKEIEQMRRILGALNPNAARLIAHENAQKIFK